jgi:hypothetical protein
MSGFLASDHLPGVSCLSGNDRGDEMLPGAVHKSPDIYLTAEVNHGKPQLGDRR